MASSDPEGKPWLLGVVLSWLKDCVPVPDVLLPTDDFLDWQKQNLWRRIQLNLEYLSFAWNSEDSESKRRLREGREGYQWLMQLVDRIYDAEDSDQEQMEAGEDEEDWQEDEEEELEEMSAPGQDRA